MKSIHAALLLVVCVSSYPSRTFAGAVNGSRIGDPGTDLRPNCDYRTVTLNKCDEYVRNYLRDNCYVVVHDKNSPQSSVCTWQSCAGLSLVGEKPQFTTVQFYPYKVFEITEYGIKSQITAPDLPSSWKCSMGKCLPKAEPINGSVQKDFNGRLEKADVFPRTYMTLGEAIDLKSNSSVQSSAALEKARILLQRPEVENVMRANPYFACAAVPKVKFWVERKTPSSSLWSKTNGVDGSSEYTVDAASWKDACRRNRFMDSSAFIYRCATENGEYLQEASDALVWLEYYYSNSWKTTSNGFRSSNWKADCPAKIAEAKKGNSFKWRCKNDQTGETLE